MTKLRNSIKVPRERAKGGAWWRNRECETKRKTARRRNEWAREEERKSKRVTTTINGTELHTGSRAKGTEDVDNERRISRREVDERCDQTLMWIEARGERDTKQRTQRDGNEQGTRDEGSKERETLRGEDKRGLIDAQLGSTQSYVVSKVS